MKKTAPKLYRFHLDIGDWSGDGHGKKETFLVESNKPVRASREAYFAAQKKLLERQWPGNIASTYGERPIFDDHHIVEIKKLGFDFKLYSELDCVDPISMAHYTLWFIMRGDPTIKAKIIPLDTFAFYGFDKKGRHTDFIGYGCFE
jgi:hypothetical protein